MITGHFKMRRSEGGAEHESMLEHAMIEFNESEVRGSSSEEHRAGVSWPVEG